MKKLFYLLIALFLMNVNMSAQNELTYIGDNNVEYISGVFKYSGEVHNGLRDGLWYSYNLSTNENISMTYFNEGEMTWHRYTDSNGRIVTVLYKNGKRDKVIYSFNKDNLSETSSL